MSWEFDILYELQSIHNPVLDAVMAFITHFGDKGLFWIALSLAILIFRKDKGMGITAVAALASEALICNLIIKPLVARQRPCWIDDTVALLISSPHDYSFPSGHTSASFAVATAIFLWDKKWGTLALIWAGLIAFSRMYLFVHFPTDVLVGLVIGVLMAVISWYIVKQFYHSESDVYIKH